jgi:hypothetical protein
MWGTERGRETKKRRPRSRRRTKMTQHGGGRSSKKKGQAQRQRGQDRAGDGEGGVERRKTRSSERRGHKDSKEAAVSIGEKGRLSKPRSGRSLGAPSPNRTKRDGA